MYGKSMSSSLKPVATCQKRFISAVWQGFEFTFVLIIFAKLFPICLLNLLNIFHHTSVLCMVKHVTSPYVQHTCLITKIIIVFLNYVFLWTMTRPHQANNILKTKKSIGSFKMAGSYTFFRSTIQSTGTSASFWGKKASAFLTRF